MSSRNTTATSAAPVGTSWWLWSSGIVGLALATTATVTWRVAVRSQRAYLEEQRLAERRGRIRAEIKLRTLVKESQRNGRAHPNNKKEEESSASSSSAHDLQLKCIGTVVSPYTKRMGTPRQGSLVPSSRGYIQLSPNISPETMEGMEGYSHLWVLFGFHANTNYSTGGGSKKGGGSSKICPPRGGGKMKVGQLASRSPHRPNPIGLSLVSIEGQEGRVLHIRALDLVHGTPVYDIKPCVPWDIPGYHYNSSEQEPQTIPKALRVPSWVGQDDALQRVEFSQSAFQSLESCVKDGLLQPLYTLENDGIAAAQNTLQEILAQDPRASTQRGTTNTTTRQETYKVLFCQVEIQFIVTNHPHLDNNNDDDDDDDNKMHDSLNPNNTASVHVVSVTPVNLDPASFVEGIPLMGNN
eukprot:scaffold295601_cov55-Attheya_sp.AAC.1